MKDTILIAASGTGGHLMPAILIANQLADHDVQFVGAGRPLEEKMIDSRGFTRHEIPIVGLQNRGVKGVLEFCLALPISLLKTLQLFTKVKPKLVIGVGGYVSVLPVILGWLKGVPTIIHECETKPGLANSALEFFATRITCAFPNVPFKYFEKVSVTGQPLKPEVVEVAKRIRLPEIPTRVLAIGGSQGARSIDNACMHLASFFAANNIEVWHQCRPNSKEEVSAAYAHAGVTARVETFIQAMEEAYEWSHCILSRSGAGSVSEIAAVNIPAIFVPFPSAQGNHQLRNANMLVESGKAILCEEGEGFDDRIHQAFVRMFDGSTYTEMVKCPPLHRKVDAASEIAAIAKNLISQKEVTSSSTQA